MEEACIDQYNSEVTVSYFEEKNQLHYHSLGFINFNSNAFCELFILEELV